MYIRNMNNETNKRKNKKMNKIIAIGSSTGGIAALTDLLKNLPTEIPPVVIVQHIPKVFSLSFANSLNKMCPFKVKEAEDGDVLKKNTVYIAPGGKQTRIRKRGSDFVILVVDEEPHNHHRPSVDILFDSVARYIKNRAIGVVLTGMGKDGAKGLLNMKKEGALTIAQDEKTSVVFGMPKSAIAIGGVSKVLPLQRIPKQLMDWVNL